MSVRCPNVFYKQFLSKNVVFRTLLEIASNDFAHFAYLDRSYWNLHFLYWQHVRQIDVFRTLSENGSNDFAHFAYLDRTYQYLQLLYWQQVLENASWHGFRPIEAQNKVKTSWLSTSSPLISGSSHWICLISHIIQV